MTTLAARRSVSLALLFLGVYGGCNWLTAQRTDVGSWYFEWERFIPFVPLMIIPYLSIDAFFLGAPFLCRDRHELGVFSRRIAVAIVVGGLCFLALPLRFAFERPAVDGLLGVLFHGFATLDRPFNLFPSLHITLAVILAEIYWRHTRGLIRIAMLVWFVLIGLSTVFTLQHHVIDVAGGLALAGVVLYAIRERTVEGYAAPRNLRMGLYYAAGSGLAVAGAVLLWPWGVFLLWPALALAIVTTAYLGAGPWVLGKSDGRIRPAARLLLWPYLLGQRASVAYYRRQCRPYDVVTPGVWIGRRLNHDEATQAVRSGVTAVLDLTAEFDEPAAFTRLPYKNVQTLDLTAPSAEALDDAVRFVIEQSSRGVVYIHCKIGYSRSAAVVCAWVLATGRAGTVAEAVAVVRRARPQVIVRPEALATIAQYQATLTGSRTTPHRAAIVEHVVSALLSLVARVICGVPRWTGAGDSTTQRIYFANHTSHLDFIAICGSLPATVRVTTRPVVGADYWDHGPVRRFLARRLLRAVVVERCPEGTDRAVRIAGARRSVRAAVEALDSGASLILFPEGTRGAGNDIAPFKSGLFHLCRARPDVELVPVLLGNLHRILPKGEMVPVPVRGSVTFGSPMRLRPGEDKAAFLTRARAALLAVDEPCPSLSTAISRAS